MPRLPLEEHWTLVVQPTRRGKNPEHLKPYQEEMRVIAPLCSKETKHLKGERRVNAMNACIRRRMKKDER